MTYIRFTTHSFAAKLGEWIGINHKGEVCHYSVEDSDEDPEKFVAPTLEKYLADMVKKYREGQFFVNDQGLLDGEFSDLDEDDFSSSDKEGVKNGHNRNSTNRSVLQPTYRSFGEIIASNRLMYCLSTESKKTKANSKSPAKRGRPAGEKSASKSPAKKTLKIESGKGEKDKPKMTIKKGRNKQKDANAPKRPKNAYM